VVSYSHGYQGERNRNHERSGYCSLCITKVCLTVPFQLTSLLDIAQACANDSSRHDNRIAKHGQAGMIDIDDLVMTLSRMAVPGGAMEVLPQLACGVAGYQVCAVTFAAGFANGLPLRVRAH